MSYQAEALLTDGPGLGFRSGEVTRRDPGPRDVVLRVEYCGICHSDLHQALGEWPGGIFPMAPGHEIAGVVEAVGDAVCGFAVGDRGGVGCFVDSCRECPECLAGREQFCRKGQVSTYNARDYAGEPTYGGYSRRLTVDERYLVKLAPSLDLAVSAPLLCAGVTFFSPLTKWAAGPGKRVAVAGFGGIGHVGVQLAHALGAEVTVISHSAAKRADALTLGADRFVATAAESLDRFERYFDLILDTGPGAKQLDAYLPLLALDGVFVPLGMGGTPLVAGQMGLAWCDRVIAGSLIGGIAQTQATLDFCATSGVGAVVELIPPDPAAVNDAYARLQSGDVRYRFVIDWT
jgi:uncharacterized zinc-type alcohol dehydrogenase-like protein